jgi:hypothetical protein
VLTAVGVPILGEFLTGRYRSHLEAQIKTPDRQIKMIERAFPSILGKTLDTLTGLELEEWRKAELKAG